MGSEQQPEVGVWCADDSSMSKSAQITRWQTYSGLADLVLQRTEQSAWKVQCCMQHLGSQFLRFRRANLGGIDIRFALFVDGELAASLHPADCFIELNLSLGDSWARGQCEHLGDVRGPAGHTPFARVTCHVTLVVQLCASQPML